MASTTPPTLGEPPVPVTDGSRARLDAHITTYDETDFSEHHRAQKNWVRRIFAIAMLAFFGLEILATFYFFTTNPTNVANIIQIMTFVVTPTITILGSISGYYFAQRAGDSDLV